jgi:hypothetical protein
MGHELLPQGVGGGWLTYTNSSPWICRSVPLTRDDWRPAVQGMVDLHELEPLDLRQRAAHPQQ